MPQPIERFLPFGLQSKSGDPIGRGGCEINFHFGAECPLHRLAFAIIIVHNKNCRLAVMFSRLIYACKVGFSVSSFGPEGDRDNLPITPFLRNPPPNVDCQLARDDGPLGWWHKELPVVMTVLFSSSGYCVATEPALASTGRCSGSGS